MVYIDNEKRLIFIENPKSGSTTIIKALEKVLNKTIIRKTPEEAHLTCKQIKEQFPQEWKNYLKITTFRDPYRRFCSSVNYPKHYNGNYNSIEEYKKHRETNKGCVYCLPQEEFTEDCDYIINLQTIQQDFDKLCHKLEVKSVKLERRNCQDTPKRFFGLDKIF